MTKKYAVLFPGQGSQYPGMGRKFNENTIFKRTMDRAFEFLGEEFRTTMEDGPLEKISLTRFTQPLVYAVSCALYYMLVDQYSFSPLLMAGHSLGEITALTCAGAVSFEKGLEIVKKRGELMTLEMSGSMGAVTGLKEQEVLEICGQVSNGDYLLVPANINSSSQIVLSGNREALDLASKQVIQKGGRFIPLNVSAPFHSPFMNKAADLFEQELLKHHFDSFQVPVLSNVDAGFYSSPAEIPAKLSMQMTSPVLWKQIMDKIEIEKIGFCIEAGPKNVLKTLLYKEKPGIGCSAIDQDEDYRKLSSIFNTNLMAFELCIKHALCVRNNSENNPDYDSRVVHPLKKMIAQFHFLKNNGQTPAREEVYEAVKMLVEVFEVKQTPSREREAGLSTVCHSITDKILINDLKKAGLFYE